MTRHWQVELNQARRRVKVLEYLLKRAERPKPQRTKKLTIMDRVESLMKEHDMETSQQIAERAADYRIGRDSVTYALKGLREAGRATVHFNGKSYGRWTATGLLVLLGFLCGCERAPEPVTGGPVVTNRPAPEVGWPVRYVTNQLPPLPRLKALPGQARQMVAAQSVTVQPAPRRSAVSILYWKHPGSPVSEFQIYTKAGVKVLTVPADYNNCTVTGFYPGETPEFYATASFIGEESEPSNTALGVAIVPTPTFTPRPRDHVWRYTWPQAVGVTNALQWSTNLAQWSNVARWRGTNGVAAVSLTNRPGFYRVRFENATTAPVTLTQTVTHVLLTWTNAPGATQRLDRLAHAASGSFVPVLTNTASGTVNLIQPAGAQWRLWKL